ncbi:MAG TPA: hypothetical protein VMX17_07920 [Candidatus Glassbacteria bacterium]|nr:hypothetical protein [Candidatus Glassbacteria bacterium]
MIVRASETHPVHRALEELYKKMDELGISLSLPSSVEPTLICYENEIWSMVDIENNDGVADFPPGLEYKLIRNKNDE